MYGKTDERIRRYEGIASELEGSASSRAGVVADKMRRGLKSDFDNEIVRIRARIKELLKGEPEDRELLETVLKAADMAIVGKRQSPHIKRRTKVNSDASAEFEKRKKELNEAIERNRELMEGIDSDEEYLALTHLKELIVAFEKLIKANSEFSKKAKNDMVAAYHKHIPVLNSVRMDYLQKTGKKHEGIKNH